MAKISAKSSRPKQSLPHGNPGRPSKTSKATAKAPKLPVTGRAPKR